MCATIVSAVKVEFMNEIVAIEACTKLQKLNPVRLGSAVVIGVNLYNKREVVNVCATLKGYFANEVTDFDKAQVLG